MERSASPVSPSQALPTCPPDPGHLHGCGRRPHLALQGHLCPEAHVLVSDVQDQDSLPACLPEGALDGGCDLAGRSGGAAVRHRESWSSWFGLGGGRCMGRGGLGAGGQFWGGTISCPDKLFTSYWPPCCTGLPPGKYLSHAWWGMWVRVGSRRPSLENGAPTWRARRLNCSLPTMGPSHASLIAHHPCSLSLHTTYCPPFLDPGSGAGREGLILWESGGLGSG